MFLVAIKEYSKVLLKLTCTVLVKIAVLFMTICAVCGFPCILIILSPLFLFRFVISKLAKRIRPDFYKIMNTRSALFTADGFFSKPLFNIVVFLEFCGEPQVELTKKLIMENILLSKNDNGEFRYPELRMYLEKWLGFTFWVPDRNFNIDNHINYYEHIKPGEVVTEEKFREIKKEILYRPFQRQKPLWDIFIIPNTKISNDSKSEGKNENFSAILRIHHAVTDGYLILRLFLEFFKKNIDLRAKPKFERRKFLNCLSTLSYPFVAAFQFVEHWTTSFDFNDWHSPLKKANNRDINLGVSEKVDLSICKKIAKQTNVSVSSVITGAVAGGISRYMKETGVKIPGGIHCHVPIPIPNHPGKLRNYTTMGIIKLPIGEKTSEERLKEIESEIKRIRKSSVPKTTFIIQMIFGALPNCMIDLSFRMFTMGLINYPGPLEPLEWCGNEVLSFSFGVGLFPGNVSLIITTLSYCGNIQYSAYGDKDIFPSDELVQRLLQNVLLELDSMNHLCHLNSV